MEILSMCRLCLAEGVRMCHILNTHLQEMYESLTVKSFKTEDSRPMQVCYICCARLQNCYKFKMTCLQSDETLTRMIHTNENRLLTPEEQTNSINLKIVHVVNIGVLDDQQNKDGDVTDIIYDVKREPAPCDTDDIPVSTYNIPVEIKVPDLTYEIPVEIIKKEPEDFEIASMNESNEELDADATAYPPDIHLEKYLSTELGNYEVSDDMTSSDTDSEYESGASGPSTKKKLRTEIVYKKCMTPYSEQHFIPSETQPTDKESRRLNKAPKTNAERAREFRARRKLLKQQKSKQQQEPDAMVEIAIEDIRSAGSSEDNQDTAREEMGCPYSTVLGTTRHKLLLNKAPKTNAERAREFRARQKLLKQQKSKQQQEPHAIVEIAIEDIRSAGSSEDNQIPGPSEIRTMEEKKQGVSRSSKKQAKTAAQRMREYRARKKLAKKILLKQQSVQDLHAIVSTSSSQANQSAGPSTINSISAELTRRGHSQSQQLRHIRTYARIS